MLGLIEAGLKESFHLGLCSANGMRPAGEKDDYFLTISNGCGKTEGRKLKSWWGRRRLATKRVSLQKRSTESGEKGGEWAFSYEGPHNEIW